MKETVHGQEKLHKRPRKAWLTRHSNVRPNSRGFQRFSNRPICYDLKRKLNFLFLLVKISQECAISMQTFSLSIPSLSPSHRLSSGKRRFNFWGENYVEVLIQLEEEAEEASWRLEQAGRRASWNWQLWVGVTSELLSLLLSLHHHLHTVHCW